MSKDFEEYKKELSNTVETTVSGIERLFFRNIIISFLFILVPSVTHYFMSDNTLTSIFILLLTSSLVIVFWFIFFEMNQRHSMTVLSAQIEVLAKKYYKDKK